MPDTELLYCILEMLEFLDGLGKSHCRIDDARAGMNYLNSRGYYLVRRGERPVLRGVCPEDLKAARKALRLTNQRLADEAGLSVNAVMRTQTSGASVRRRTVDAVVAALFRLGAGLPGGGESLLTTAED